MTDWREKELNAMIERQRAAAAQNPTGREPALAVLRENQLTRERSDARTEARREADRLRSKARRERK